MKNEIPWDIIVSKLRSEATADEEKTFEEWLNQCDNQRIFSQIESVWNKAGEKAGDYNPDVQFNWNKLSARIATQEKPTARQLTLQSLYRKIAVAAAILALVATGLFYTVSNHSNRSSRQQISQTYSAQSEKTKTLLPDGSEIWLNSNSSITYSEDGDLRKVAMNGEVYFSVKHDAKRAFVVTANDLNVKVHGTQFNVKSCPASNQVFVSLFQGSVSLQSGEQTVFLHPGEEGLFDRKRQTINVETGDIEMAKLWTNDRIRFERKNLREVCRYLSKWYNVEIVIDPQISNAQSYTFTLKDQSLEEVVKIIAQINSIDYSFSQNKKTLYIKHL